MKDKALYHLLQLRGRKLQEQLPAEVKVRMAEIQRTLYVQRGTGEYTLDWQLGGRSFNLKTDGNIFWFYEKGDSAKSVARRGEQLNYRAQNWQSALELWRKIFTVSGLEQSVLADDGGLAFGDFSPVKFKYDVWGNLAISAVVAGVALFYASTSVAILVFLMIFPLLTLAQSYAGVQLRQYVNIKERILIAAGILVPVFMHSFSVGMVGITLGLCCLSLVERQFKYAYALTIIAGIGFGIAHQSIAGVALASVLSLWTVMTIISFIDKTRVPRAVLLLLPAGFTIGIALCRLIDVSQFSVNGSIQLLQDPNLLNYSTLAIFIALIFCFALWWIVGVQYYLLPWIFLLVLAITALVVYFRQVPVEQIPLLGFSGFILFILQRLIRGFVTTKKPVGNSYQE